jgi:eukaryotic-like serine/threonine-protein kinase
VKSDVPDRPSWDQLLEGELASGDVLAEKYRLDAVIGRGAMGFVLRAWHLQLEEPVAVKFLLPELAENAEALARFEREARAAFKIKSEHVSRVLDVGRIESGAPFMVMEFLEGTDIAQIIESRAPIPVDEAVDYLLQACDAIAEAHNLGIVHRDLKPENLFVTRRRDGSACVKVLDFGLSKLLPLDPNKRQRALTSSEQVMGTAHYMSPEQWMSTKDVGPETDIWSLGVILYEAITAHSPFLRDKLAQMCNAVLRDKPPPLADKLPSAPPGLEDAILCCLHKTPEDRYATVGELAEALAPFGTESGHALALRIARVSEQAPSSIPMSVPGSRYAPSPPVEIVHAKQPTPSEPKPLPRLGLRESDGTVDTWHEIIHEAPPAPSSRRTIAIGAALLFLALLLLGIAWTSDAGGADLTVGEDR